MNQSVLCAYVCVSVFNTAVGRVDTAAVEKKLAAAVARGKVIRNAWNYNWTEAFEHDLLMCNAKVQVSGQLE